MTIPNEALKVCNGCGESKPLSDFYIRTSGRPHAACKVCYRKKVAARKQGKRRAEVLKMDNAALRAKRKRVRDQVFEAYGGYKCVCCGETEPLFLSIDHVDNDGAEFRRSVLGKRTMAGYHTYVWLLQNDCPRSVQVLCMNCQHGKRMNKGICPHQRTCNDYPAREYGQAAGSAEPLIEGDDIV